MAELVKADDEMTKAMENVSISGGSSTASLVPKVTISALTSEVFCIRFSPDGKFLAAGCGDGAIRVFNVQNGNLAYNLQGGSNVALVSKVIDFGWGLYTVSALSVEVVCFKSFAWQAVCLAVVL